MDCDHSNVNLAGSPHRPMRTWLWSPRKARNGLWTDVLCCCSQIQAWVRAASSSILGDGERTGLRCSRQMLHSRTLTRPRTCVWENHHGAQWHDPNYTDTAMPWELKAAHADHPSCRAMWCRHRPLAQSLPSASAPLGMWVRLLKAACPAGEVDSAKKQGTTVLFVCSEINISSLIFTTFGSFYHANESFPKTHAIISGSGQNQRRVFTTSSA